MALPTGNAITERFKSLLPSCRNCASPMNNREGQDVDDLNAPLSSIVAQRRCVGISVRQWNAGPLAPKGKSASHPVPAVGMV
jgi:hypothetical protein